MPIEPAHQTWFLDDDRFDSGWSFITQPATLALLAAAVALTAALRIVGARRDGIDVGWLGAMAQFMPFAVRIHLAVSLIGLLALGKYLSPTMNLQSDLTGILLGAVMAVVAIGMVTGFRTREAAWLLVFAGPIGMLEFGVLEVVQRIDMLGPALFVVIAGPGRWSADWEMGRQRDPDPTRVASAVWALRVLVGLAVIVVAYVEKLGRPDYALAFLVEHPELNVADALGLGWSDEAFVRLAGSVEVLFGLLLISGRFPQAVVLLVGVPFNVTLYFFGEVELVGHLPMYGTMLVLLVYGSDPAIRPLVSRALPSWPPGGESGAGAARRSSVPASR